MVRSSSVAALLVVAFAPLAPAQFNPPPQGELKPSFGSMREDRGTADRPYDLVKVHVQLQLDEKAKKFSGSTTNHLVALASGETEVWFDAEEMDVQGAKVDGATAPFKYEKSRVTVTLPAPAKMGQAYAVEVDYAVSNPKRGLWFQQPSADQPDVHYEIWSQGEAEDNRRWIPTWDYPSDRATYEGEFTVRDGLTVVSNGKLVDKKARGDGWTTWHYALDFPFSSYLISLCVGDYEKYVDDWRGVPVEYYVQRGVGEAKARRSFGQTPDMLEFFSNKIGVPYPYPKYSQVAVQNFIVGGMENISATTQTDSTLHDDREHLDRESQNLVAHELAHQWWGDYLTCRTFRHLWLNEGFAQFFEALYNEKVNGTDAFRIEMRGNQQQACASMNRGAPRPLVESFFNRAPQGDGSNAVYVRGASVLHMVRTLLGEEAWWKAMHHYCTKHAGQLVDSKDLEDAIEEATGRNLHWLFEEYVYLPGHPKFAVTQRYDADKKEVVLSVKQTQDTSNMVPVFKYPVPIEVVCAPSKPGDSGRALHTVWIDQKEQEVRLPAPSAPLMVAFDQGSAMLKEVDFKKPAAELAFIAQGGDDDAVARQIAVEQLPESDDKALARKALIAVLGSKEWRDVRTTAASGLAKLGGGGDASATAAVVTALSSGAKDSESRVRRACISALGQIAKELGDAKPAVAALVADALRNDKSYSVQGAACETLAKVGGDDALVALRAATDYASPNDRVGAAALRARLALDDKMAVDEVFAMARGQGDSKRRGLGLQAFGGMNDQLLAGHRDEAIQLLMDAAQKGGNDVMRAAISSLGELKAVEAEEFLKKLATKEDGPRFLRFVVGNALRQIGEAKKATESATTAAVAAAKPPPTNDELAKTIDELKKQIDALQKKLNESAPPAAGSAPASTPTPAPAARPAPAPSPIGGGSR
jgi:aminopeptidase N